MPDLPTYYVRQVQDRPIRLAHDARGWSVTYLGQRWPLPYNHLQLLKQCGLTRYLKDYGNEVMWYRTYFPTAAEAWTSMQFHVRALARA